MVFQSEVDDIRATIKALWDKQDEVDRKIAQLKIHIAELEAELLEKKGPCSNPRCRLHYAHSGPCEQLPIGVTR